MARRRLPGVSFDASAPVLAEALPRMDIAVFVGFTSTGPLHVPVAVESVAEYAATFGPDPPLAWDPDIGARRRAHMGASVRLFFSNGGRRCWVIRVARSVALERVRLALSPGDGLPPPGSPPSSVAATYNRFPLPGILAATTNGASWQVNAAVALARCEGSWSDDIRVATALVAQSIAVVPLGIAPGAPTCLRFRTAADVGVGDVLKFGGNSDLCIFMHVVGATPVHAASGLSSPLEARNARETVVEPIAGFQAVHTDVPLADTPGAVEIPDFDGAVVVVPALLSIPIAADSPPSTATGASPSLHFTITGSAAPAVGQWIPFDAPPAERCWLRIDTLTRRVLGHTPLVVEFVAQGPAWWQVDVSASALPLPDAALARCTKLELDITARQSVDRGVTTHARGLASDHVSSWQQQATDEHYYRAVLTNSEIPPGIAGVQDDAERFPLAAGDINPKTGLVANAAFSVLLPLGTGALASTETGPLPQSVTALERDGLADFDVGLFVDPALASSDVRALIPYADLLRFTGPAPRDLFGMHAALGSGEASIGEEVTLIALPDAVHPGWDRFVPPDPIPPRDAPPRTRPAWRTHSGACLLSDNNSPPVQPLSEPDWGHFLDCATRVVAAPQFIDPPLRLESTTFLLEWTMVATDAIYVLEEARLDNFADAHEIHRGSSTSFEVFAAGPGVRYYRVFAIVNGEMSDWSLGIAVLVGIGDFMVRSSDAETMAADEPTLAAIHRALLRLCAASGDLFAVLTLPDTYRSPAAIGYADRLRSAIPVTPPIDPAELLAGFDIKQTLSYGALYHPWLIERSGDRELRTVPPDGAACGVLATRARQRGAWIAPANELLQDVVALTPVLDEASWPALQDAQVNLIRHDVRGMLALAADTLAIDADLRPISVRRLLILLRRLALRRGAAFVFEPNGDVLRRAVQRTFDGILTDLFDRGAFAGRNADDSFQVVTDAAVNSTESMEAGRFLIDLKVAPSIPMQFLTVRLQQTGERLTVLEER